MGGAYTGLQPA